MKLTNKLYMYEYPCEKIRYRNTTIHYTLKIMGYILQTEKVFFRWPITCSTWRKTMFPVAHIFIWTSVML